MENTGRTTTVSSVEVSAFPLISIVWADSTSPVRKSASPAVTEPVSVRLTCVR
jgi:hypothetical protein